MQLPAHLAALYQPFFDALPMDKAMPHLLPRRPADELPLKLAYGIVDDERISTRPDLVAGTWLYVDHLDAAHSVAQGLATQTGSLWHAIVHRREGDFGNALYWYRAAGSHPALDKLASYDPRTLVEYAKVGDERAMQLQRSEWEALFVWCANQWS